MAFCDCTHQRHMYCCASSVLQPQQSHACINRVHPAAVKVCVPNHIHPLVQRVSVMLPCLPFLVFAFSFNNSCPLQGKLEARPWLAALLQSALAAVPSCSEAELATLHPGSAPQREFLLHYRRKNAVPQCMRDTSYAKTAAGSWLLLPLDGCFLCCS